MLQVYSGEMVRVVHEQMIDAELRRQRYGRQEPSFRALESIRAATARFLIALGGRIDPVPEDGQVVRMSRSQRAA